MIKFPLRCTQVLKIMRKDSEENRLCAFANPIALEKWLGVSTHRYLPSSK